MDNHLIKPCANPPYFRRHTFWNLDADSKIPFFQIIHGIHERIHCRQIRLRGHVNQTDHNCTGYYCYHEEKQHLFPDCPVIISQRLLIADGKTAFFMQHRRILTISCILLTVEFASDICRVRRTDHRISLQQICGIVRPRHQRIPYLLLVDADYHDPQRIIDIPVIDQFSPDLK